jgi:hypothetical protein
MGLGYSLGPLFSSKGDIMASTPKKVYATQLHNNDLLFINGEVIKITGLHFTNEAVRVTGTALLDSIPYQTILRPFAIVNVCDAKDFDTEAFRLGFELGRQSRINGDVTWRS